MEQSNLPVKSSIEAVFYYLYVRIVKRVPVSVFTVLLILLVSFSVATGYFIKGGSAVRPDQLSTFTTTSPIKAPEARFTVPGKNSAKRYTISLGSYVLKRNFEDEKALADSLGQPFHIVVSEKRVTLTRLFLGLYSQREATAVLAHMKEISPASFGVHNELYEMVSVYGGSFYYFSDAENQEALFALHGVKATKVPTRKTLPLYTVCMGDFDDKAMAVEFLRTAGLSTIETTVMAML